MKESKRAVCEMCHSRCRVVVHSENGRLIDIEEDRSFPLVDNISPPTKACIRLRGAKEITYHPDRINFPLKRVGDKGEGKWQRIPWDQALDEIAAKLSEIKDGYGAEAISSSDGTGRTRHQWIDRFHNLIGSPNHVGINTICFAPCIGTGVTMFGWPLRHRMGLTIEKGANGSPTKSAMLIGVNPSQTTLRMWKSILDAKELGVKIIVIDPRKTKTAEIADIWLQVRPGTDTALLMSMINVIIEEGLYDKEFVENWCHGFKELTERAREYPPEKVADITWIPAERIRETARTLAQYRPGPIINGMGIEHQTNSIQGIQAKFILSAILGNIDIEGGEYIPGPPKCIADVQLACEDAMTAEQKAKQLGADRFKLLSWPGREAIEPDVVRVWGQPWAGMRVSAFAHTPTVLRAIATGKPYPVKAMLTNASNPMLNHANTRGVYKALKSLDLYVVTDFWMTPSADLADYVMPAASWIERPCLFIQHGTDDSIRGGERALPSTMPGEYERWTEYDYFRGLGTRLGQDWPWKNDEETFDYMLQPMKMSFQEFMDSGGHYTTPRVYRKYEKTGFGTPTGKVELYSTTFEKLGYDPLPRYEESRENPISTPELAKEYPLMLITGGKFMPMFHSEYRQIESIRKRHPHPLAQVHPETAKKYDIANGDWIWIESPRGKIRMKCQYFDGISPQVVHAEHGWWFPELPGQEPWLHGVWESNANVLTDDDPDVCNAMTGGWPLRTALCKIEKVKQY